MSHSIKDMSERDPSTLKRGWTTGACATASVKAALTALLSGSFPDPVSITLPKGETPSFALALEEHGGEFARAGIVKDAGDDPDVTHGAMIIARVSTGTAGKGVHFFAGNGVGIITKPGLPIDVGEAAVNPVPRAMMQAVVEEIASTHGIPPDFNIEISIPDGEALALKTWNPRLGIVGGLSILGTTGIVHPFSCSAWIHSIHRGIDVARAEGLTHVIGSTGSTSETAAQAHYGLPDHAMLDMGDFAGGVLKYLRNNSVPRVTLAGGFAKLTKLGQGFLDLHSGRSQVDFTWLANLCMEAGRTDIASFVGEANTAAHARSIALEAGLDLAPFVANKAHETAVHVLRGAPIDVNIMVVDRNGRIVAQSS